MASSAGIGANESARGETKRIKSSRETARDDFSGLGAAAASFLALWSVT